MPRHSEERGYNLLSIEECAQLFGKSRGTINNRISQRKPYVEHHQVEAGKRPLVFVDPYELGYELPQELRQEEASRAKSREARSGNATTQAHDSKERSQPDTTGSSSSKASGPLTLREARESTSRAKTRVVDLHQARDRVEKLGPIVTLSKRERRKAIAALAKAEEVTTATVYRWIREFKAQGVKALGRKRREDRGRMRIPAEALQLVTQALISNPPTTSVKMIHRSLIRAVPEVMTYPARTQSGIRMVSVSTVQRLKERLLDDPFSRLLFYDADKRKEHLRSYAGEVFSAHANQLWQMDMTRCDVLVCDAESHKIFRPRVHAIIDVYSGCIPGWVFALEEDQTQTDLALLRAFVPKPAPYADAWPVYGTPERLYWDNGKTYSSEHARRTMADLGIEVVYSKPRVSHTRGKIERFFGTLHNFEKSLPGYVGENAKDRATEELRRITKNSKRWLERGLSQDPGWGNRLLTLVEYQERMTDWLLGEYHDWVVDSQSRLAHFLESVAEHPRTQRLYSRDDLLLTLARRTTRRVNPDGSIRLNNQFWTLESGELINYANREVLVLSNQFARGAAHLIAWQEPHGGLHVLGDAIPMPDNALSEAAYQQRLASNAAAKRSANAARVLKGELFNPNTVVSKVLRDKVQAELEVEPLPKVERSQTRLTALEGPKQLLPDDDFTKSFGEVLDVDDPKEYLKRVKAHYQGRDKGSEQ